MSYQALARKWRPKTFDQVIGQDHIISALSNALNQKKVHHAFLFTGTRGVGKTTIARIFAKALNCEKGVSAYPCGCCNACKSVNLGNFVDLIEVDAASRTKVEDTRDLLANVPYTPTQGRYKLYLIDEVHMLSNHSFNALLKTLEEPPLHVKFLLATTNPQKLPTTILSRCIQFNLKSMDINLLLAQMEKILKAENISYESDALMILAKFAYGSARDALSLLDQAILFSNGEIKLNKIRQMLGMIDDQYIVQITEQLFHNQFVELLRTIEEISKQSVDFNLAIDELLTLIHNISLFLVSPESVAWKELDLKTLKRLSMLTDLESLQLLYQIGLLGKRDLSLAPDPKIGFEMTILRMIAFQPVNTKLNDYPNTSQGTSFIGKSSEDHMLKSELSAFNINEDKPTDNKIDKIEMNDCCALRKKKWKETSYVNSKKIKNLSTYEVSDKMDLPFSTECFSSKQGWDQFVNQSRFHGITKELLINLVPISFDGKVITLILNKKYAHLVNNNRIQKIEEHCLKQLQLNLVFKVKIGHDKNGDIPNSLTEKRYNNDSESHLFKSNSSIINPYVQEMIDIFDAKIVKH